MPDGALQPVSWRAHGGHKLGFEFFFDQLGHTSTSGSVWVHLAHHDAHHVEVVVKVMGLVARGAGVYEAVFVAQDVRQRHGQTAIPQAAVVGAGVAHRGERVQDSPERINPPV